MNEAQLAKAMEIHEARQATLTDDQRAENKAKMGALFSDPAKIEEMKSNAKAQFVASDVDGDGKLNKAEFLDHCKKSETNGKAQGWHVPEQTDESLEAWWNLLVEVTGSSELSEDQLNAINGQVMGAIKAKNE